MSDQKGRSKCQGIKGLLFGHKFHHTTSEWVEYFPHCVRCGMPKGGWAVPAVEGKPSAGG